MGGFVSFWKEFVFFWKEFIFLVFVFGGDERYFNLVVINGESIEVKRLVNGGNIEDELGFEFGKVIFLKFVFVVDIVVYYCLIIFLDFNMNRRLYFLKYFGFIVVKII